MNCIDPQMVEDIELEAPPRKKKKKKKKKRPSVVNMNQNPDDIHAFSAIVSLVTVLADEIESLAQMLKAKRAEFRKQTATLMAMMIDKKIKRVETSCANFSISNKATLKCLSMPFIFTSMRTIGVTETQADQLCAAIQMARTQEPVQYLKKVKKRKAVSG